VIIGAAGVNISPQLLITVGNVGAVALAKQATVDDPFGVEIINGSRLILYT
jgi:hypothetical protein